MELLTPKQEQALSELDQQAKSVVLGSAVMDLVGVLAGVKPAAYIVEEAEHLKPYLDDLGLAAEYVQEGRAVISRDESLVRSVVEDLALKRSDDEADYRVGAALGYPKTATDYFLKRRSTLFTGNELPIVYPEPGPGVPGRLFAQIVLSPDHYQDEIDAYVRPLEEATKHYAPHTYKMLTKE